VITINDKKDVLNQEKCKNKVGIIARQSIQEQSSAEATITHFKISLYYLMIRSNF
jgi:hypothetical protein